ncbi:MAG: hypothetical protein ACM3WR_00805 [Solirubrobacterales bacterium]
MKPSVRRSRRSRDALWRAAPRVLLRYPALLLTVMLGTALLSLAAAAAPLFLSASSSEIVVGSLERPHITRYMAGITYRFTNLPLTPLRFAPGARSPSIGDLDAAFGELAAGSPQLAAPIEEVLGDPVSLSFEGRNGTQTGRLFGAADAPSHVERLVGREGDGVWLSEMTAQDLGVRPGDTIELTDASQGHHRVVEVAVDGIYADFYLALPPDGYWLQWEPKFRLKSLENDQPPPPQPILTGLRQAIALTRSLGQTTATFSWQAPVADPDTISLEDVQALDRYRQPLESLSFADTRIGTALQCCRRYGFVQVPGGSTSIGSSIDDVAADAERRIATVQGPAQVLEMAALAVAMVVVAASGAFSLRARRTEAEWLFARGMSPTSVAVKSAIETFIPSLAGGALGAAFAVLAVRVVGPDGAIHGSAYVDALVRTAVAVGAAVALGSTVAALAYVRLVDPHHRGLARLVGAVPWELGVVWLGYLAYRRLETGGAFFTDERLGVDRPSLALVAFPFLMLAGLAFLAARAVLPAFRAMRASTARAAPPMYLATRRLAAGGVLAMSLMGAAGLCLGMFVHSRLVSGSLEATVDTKSKVYVGSDVSAQIAYVSSAPTDLSFPVTRVVQASEILQLPSGMRLDLLAIDPSTFSRAAYWNEGFGAPSLDALTRPLVDRGGEGPLPIVLAGGGNLDVNEVVLGTTTIPVRVVARVDAFPGLYSLRPLLVVDESALLDRIDGPNPLASGWAELWAPGASARLLDALAARQVPVYLTITAEEVRDIPAISATIGTFAIVDALGTIAAALVVVSMLAYVRARQRSQIVSYALSTRMGMTHTAHRRALTLELGMMMAIGLAVGVALAVLTAAVTVPRLDPIPSIPPGPLLLVPLRSIVVAAVGVALVSWVGAAVITRQARAADLDEVMRVAD